MILPLLLLLQASDTFTRVTVRSATSVDTIPVVFTRLGPMVRADSAADVLDGLLRPAPNGRFLLAAAGVQVEVTPNSPFLKRGEEIIPLPYEPILRDGVLYLPYGYLTEVLPRIAYGWTYDRARAELKQVGPAIAARSPAAKVDSAGSGARTAKGGRSAVVPGSARTPTRDRKRVVVVDAGHGGPDNGMSGPIGAREKLFEKDITLQVARQVRSMLHERGVVVVMTRDADTLIALADRGRIANERQGDIFLSIHVNAANLRWRQPGAARGFETYFLSEAKTEDARRVEQMENEVVKYEIETDVSADDPLKFIIHDMEQNEHLRESSDLAETIQRRLGKVHPGPDRGVKQAGFRVLVTALMPSVLIEIGFGTNPADAAYIRGAAGQRVLARAIADATMEYLSLYERRTNVGGQ